MTLAHSQSRFSSDVPFTYVGGDVSLDFVNTTDWTERGLESDRFSDYMRVLEWARGAAILDATQERRLRLHANAHPRQAAAAYEQALETRAVLQQVFASVAGGRLTRANLDELNRLLATSATQMRLVRATGEARGRIARAWAGFGETLESVVWPVVWSAAELLPSPDIEALRVCAGVDCGWMYIDRSRNGLRRWCEMATCGTAAKNRRRARR